MKKFLLKFFKFSLILLLLAVGTFTLVLYLFSDNIKAAAIEEINNQLAVPIKVQKLRVSIRKFPSASLLLEDVYTNGFNSPERDTLLFAHNIFLEFDLWRIIFSQLSFKKISIEEGILNIAEVKKGTYNYRIWKQDNVSSGSIFELEEVEFRNMKSTFQNSANVKTTFFTKALSLSGFVEADKYFLETDASILLDNFIVKNDTFLTQVPLAIELNLANKKDTFNIREGNILAGKIPFDFSVLSTGENTSVTASGSNIKWDNIISLAKSQGWIKLHGIQLSGETELKGELDFPKGKKPYAKLSFLTQEASLEGIRESAFKNIYCEGYYELKNGKSDLKLSEIRGKGESGVFEGSFAVNDFSSPLLELELRSDLSLEEYLSFTSIDTLENVKGRAIINARFKNRFSSLKNISTQELKRAQTDGTISLKDVSFSFANSNQIISHLNSDLVLSNNLFKIDQFYLKKGESDLYMKGYFENVLNSVFFDHETISVYAKVISQEIVLDDFLIPNSEKPGSYSLSFTKSLLLDLDLQIDRLKFQNFNARNITANLNINRGRISANTISLEADGGSYQGSFKIDATSGLPYPVFVSLKADDIDINKLFVSFKNFGQEAILAENIYGTTNTDLQMKGLLNHKLKVDPASVELEADMSIANGSLKNYQPLEALSRFSDIKELQNVRFATLTNHITIKNSEIIIPEMQVSSNVLDLQLSGKHTFANYIDYTIKLKMSDLLFGQRKLRKGNKEFDEHLVEVEKGDNPKIPVRMFGQADKPEITIDKKTLGKSIIEEIREQGKKIRSLFKEKKQPPEPEEKIIFEWEEDTSYIDKN